MGIIVNLETVLNNNLQLPVKMMPYFRNLTISNESLKAASMVRYSSFLNVITSLISWEEMKVNLIPEEIKIRRSLEERGRDLIKAGIFTLTVFVLIFSILISKIYFKSSYLKNLNNKYQTLNQET